MIIPTIVKVLKSLDESQKSAHKKIDALHRNMQTLLGALGASRKPVLKEREVNCSAEELRVAMHDKSQIGLESAQISYALSKAKYEAGRLNLTLTKSEISKLKYVLENYKTLYELAGESRSQTSKIEHALMKLSLKMRQVDKMHVQNKAVLANQVRPKSKVFRPG